MSYADGKHRVIFLAREAASRFVPRRVRVKSRRQVWRPLALGWRRIRKLAERVTARGAGTVATFPTFSQLHFHFATYITERLHRSVASPPSTVAYERRTVIERLAGDVRPAMQSLQPDRQPGESFLKPVADARPIVSWKTTVQNTTQFHRSRLFAPTIVYRRKSLITAPPSTPRYRTSANQESTPGLSLQRRVFETAMRTFSVRTQTISEYVEPRRRERTAFELKFHSPEELVWRRAPGRQLELADDSQGVEASPNPVQRSAVRTVPFQESTVAVAHVNEKPTVAHITKLDPALVDRLTDDVIRRMEQRVRIERQRRGL